MPSSPGSKSQVSRTRLWAIGSDFLPGWPRRSKEKGGRWMPYNAGLAARVKEILEEHGEVDERKMFGGIAFMVRGYMCCGVLNDDLVLRLGPDGAEKALKEAHVRPMDFTGRAMKGYVFVAPAAITKEAALRGRVRSALDFVETLPPKATARTRTYC